MGLVIAVSGLPAAGKGEFATILAATGIPVRSMGDMVRAEVRARGIPEAPHVFGEVASDLRAEHGDDVLAHRLVSAVDELLASNSIVLIEGLRGTAERDVFEKHWGDSFKVVAIIASKQLRFERVQSRARSEDGDLSDLEKRDQRETGWGLDTIIEQAEISFSNEGELEHLQSEVSSWLNTL
ncbi:MAG: dephospho-CoA kinase [Euryarchaeota archaeon]|nr:dephospho-CoA kinase [Euryarchaeota archaeon]|tara:strand:- start:3560 stop:4105 length:546 start_codon:yes stop_codon:yes gene_type:complete